jgi:hypothetical protein
MALKAVHIPRNLNTSMDKLSHLEMSGDYSLPPKTFQFIKMLSNSGYVRFKKEPIIEEICISDTDKRSGQYRECTKNRLEKIHMPRIITSPDSSDSENYTEVCQQRIESDSDHTEMEGTSMVDSSRGIE